MSVKFIKTRNTYTATVESDRLHAEITVHTLWFDGTVSERRMPLHEAMQYAATWAGRSDCKAITLYK